MSSRKLMFRLISAFALTVLLSGSAPGATVFTEDFEGIDISGGPAALTTGNSTFTTQVLAGTGGSLLVVDTDPPLLQSGGTNSFTGSQYLQYVDGSQQPRVRGPLSSALTSGFVASFDYFEPNETTGTQTAFRFVLSNGDAGTTTNRALEINLHVPTGSATGTLTAIGTGNPAAAINANELIHVDLVGNFGPGTVNYAAGSTFSAGNVDQFTYDVYINGTLAIPNAPFRNNLASANEVALVSGSTAGVETSYIDNIVVDNALPVPEPSAFLLLCLGFVGLAASRRHQQSR